MKAVEKIVNFLKEQEIENIAICYEEAIDKNQTPHEATCEGGNEKSSEVTKKSSYIVLSNRSLTSAFKNLPNNASSLSFSKNLVLKENAKTLQLYLNEPNKKIELKLEDICLERSFVSPFFSRKTLMLLADNAILDNSIYVKQLAIYSQVDKKSNSNGFQDYINEVISVLEQVGVAVSYALVKYEASVCVCNFDIESPTNTYGNDIVRKFNYVAKTLAEIFNREIEIGYSGTKVD